MLRGGYGRAARPCRRGRPAGAGAGWSRAVTDGTPSPLPGVEAAGPAAGRRGALACRPGPQASTLHSGRPVKSPGPGPRADTGRCPARPEEETAPAAGRPRAGYREGGTVARTAKVRATVVHAPDAGQAGEGTAGCAQRVMLSEGSVMGWLVPPAADFSAPYRNRVLRTFFHSLPGSSCWRGRAARLLCRGPVKMSVLPRSCRCRCRLSRLLVGGLAVATDGQGRGLAGLSPSSSGLRGETDSYRGPRPWEDGRPTDRYSGPGPASSVNPDTTTPRQPVRRKPRARLLPVTGSPCLPKSRLRAVPWHPPEPPSPASLSSRDLTRDGQPSTLPAAVKLRSPI